MKAELDLRTVALELAIRDLPQISDTAAVIIRAEAFLKFLKGVQKGEPKKMEKK